MLLSRLLFGAVLVLAANSCGLRSMMDPTESAKQTPIDYESPSNTLRCHNEFKPTGTKITLFEVNGSIHRLDLESLRFYVEARDTIRSRVLASSSATSTNPGNGVFRTVVGCSDTVQEPSRYNSVPGVSVPYVVDLKSSEINQSLYAFTYLGIGIPGEITNTQIFEPSDTSLIEWFKVNDSWDALEFYRDGDYLQVVHSYQHHDDPPELKAFEFYIAKYRVL